MQKDYDTQISSVNKYGEWVPAIPEPFWRGFGLRKAECTACVEQTIFKDRTSYRGHYALVHILGL